MKYKEIIRLQHIFFDEIQLIYEAKGFKQDRKRWCFSNPIARFLLYVDTKLNPSYYTLRPGIEITYPKVIDAITQALKSKNESIKFSSHFFLSNKLAEAHGIKKYSFCEENDFGKNKVYFIHKISNDQEAKDAANRHQEILNDYGWATLDHCMNLSSYQSFLNTLFSNFYQSFKSHPDRSIIERPLRMTREAYLTMTWLNGITDSHQNLINRERMSEIFGADAGIISNVDEIIKHTAQNHAYEIGDFL